MVSLSCPLCGCKRYIKHKTYKSKDIINCYKESFEGVDVFEYFPESEFSKFECVNCRLKFYYPVLPASGEFYEFMQRFPWYYQEDKPEYDYAIEQIIKINPETILEVGCGAGLFLDKIKSAYKVKASEYNEKAIKKLKELGIELDNETDKYDMVISFQVLEHVPNVNDFINHCIYKLKDGGYLLIAVPNNDSKYMKEFFQILDLPPHHMTQWSKEALLNLSKFFDLELIEYYTEEISHIQFRQLIDKRRRDIPLNNLFDGERGRKNRDIIATIDRVLSPYFSEIVNIEGHTHAVLMKKR